MIMLKIEELREIIKMIDESSIQEFTYENNDIKINMKKPQLNQIEQETKVTKEVNNQHNEVPANVQQAEPASEETPKDKEPDQPPQVNYDYEIVSPMVGTLYHAPSPDSDPYVTVGSRVTKDSIVCIVEAMKLFNEIEAEVDGEIVEVLVENGELVEYGQPLFRVKTL